MLKKWCGIYWVLKKMVHSLKDSRIYYHQQFLYWKPGLNLFVQFRVKCIEFKPNMDVNQKFDNNEDNLTKLWRDLLHAKYTISLKESWECTVIKWIIPYVMSTTFRNMAYISQRVWPRMMIPSPSSPDIVTLGEKQGKSIQNFLKKSFVII